MTPMQKQAVLVCVICVLAALLTAGITTALLKRGKTPAANEPAASEPQSVDPTKTDGDLAGHYQINNASSALLTETADAGSDIRTAPSSWAIPIPSASTTTASSPCSSSAPGRASARRWP